MFGFDNTTTHIVADPQEATHSITITNVSTKKTVAILYFFVPAGVGCGSIFKVLGDYNEYCSPDLRIDVANVKNGRRFIEVK